MGNCFRNWKMGGMLMKYLLVTGMIGLLCSCNILKSMESAKENAEKAALNSEKAACSSEIIYYIGQGGGTEEAKRNVRKAMGESRTFDEKARHAASFMKSLTNQSLLKIKNPCALKTYETYKEKILKDDIAIVGRLITELKKSNKYNITKTKGLHGDVKAVAAAIHKTNSFCEEVHGENCKSIYDIVTETLVKYHVMGYKRSELNTYEREVLIYEDEFLFVLELRAKFLPLIAMSQVSELNDSLLKKAKMLLKDWKPAESKKPKKSKSGSYYNYGYNEEEIVYFVKIMDEAIKTRDFLRENFRYDREKGIEESLGRAELPWIVKRLLSKMNLDEIVLIPGDENDRGSYDEEEILRFSDVVNDVLDNANYID
jgi:hypothetical protein